ncbi:MAG TPA: copper amine oxidase N-terminal domain-containing protein, partial [Emcibacteraceae bacterium]|nr:copper amine oxidase N-terminal domain-containing protein [Emcibacteraceae bacterium]
IIVLSLLLLAMLAAPAAAASTFSLKVNDKAYDGEFSVIDGTTIVPLDFAGSIIGAQTTVENEQIKIEKDKAVMMLTLNSKQASFNQKQEDMLQAPARNNDTYMVPLRYVMESFGTQVEWNPATYEIIVKPVVLTEAEKTFAQIPGVMIKSNTYKMKIASKMDMDMTMDGEDLQMSMSSTVNASMSQNPLILVADTIMNIDAFTGTEEEIPADLLKTQIVLNEDGYFMTMPGQEGWVKAEMEGIDFNKLMEQYGSQDPIRVILQMKEFGAVISEKEDQVIDGKTYGVLHIVMGQEAYAKYLNDMIGKTGLLGMGVNEEDNAEFEAEMKELLNNFKADIAYDIIYDKDTLLPSNIKQDTVTSLSMTVPADEANGTPASEMQMKMNQKAEYQIYDYGIAFPVPIIDDYKTMDELMAEMTAEIPEEI